MKRKLVTYFPIAVLAVGLVLGMAAAFAAVTFIGSPDAEAAASPDTSGAQPARNINERLTSAVLATAPSSGTITATPNDPGVASRITIRFKATTALNQGDEIVIRLEDDFQAAIPLVTNLITIAADDVSGTGAADNLTVRPDGVATSLEGPENDEPEIRLTVPDLDPSDTATGGNGISAGANVTVIFQQGAGIRNPSEAGNYELFISTSNDTDTLELDGDGATNKGLNIPVRVSMNTNGDPRGSSMTAVALGLDNGTTATYWLDKDGDGVRDATERDLCSVVVASDDTATCTFTISNPPFFPGIGTEGDDSCDVDLDGDGILNADELVPLPILDDCNFINVQDGENITNNAGQQGPRTSGFPFAKDEISQATVDRQTFELEPTIDAQPRSANTGDRITISVFDFPAGDFLEEIRLAGVDVTPDDLNVTIPSSGQTSFTFTIPGVGPDGCEGNACIRVPTGVQRIEIFGDSGANQDLNITIGGAKITSSHKDVIGNQDLTISLSGFTERGGGDEVCIPQAGQEDVPGGVTLNNVFLEIDEDDDCDLVIDGNNVDGVELTGGGTATFTAIVRDFETGDVPTALLTEGTVELKVIDTSGSEGAILVNIPAREITVTPLTSRPRDPVTIAGKFFIADNPDGSDATISVEYDCGNNETRSTTADPDASGSFSETLNIPSDCTIPSTNTIKAEIFVGGESTGVVETVTHNIPDAVVTVGTAKGKSGDLITVTGDGFRTFDTVEKIDIGGRGTLGGRTINTDARGAFSVEGIQVPGLDPGIHSVIVEVGTDQDRTTASTTFEVVTDGVSAPGTPPSAPIPVGTALATPLGTDFVRAFHFNNQTKVWSFSDPRPEFTAINTLKEVSGGQVYWVNVANDKTITFCGRSTTLYKGWNQTPC